MDFRECLVKMILQTWDYRVVKFLFACFLAISAVLVVEGMLHYFLAPDMPKTNEILAAIFMHLIPCLYIPLIGLWCLPRYLNLGYFLCGIDIVYLIFQLHCLLYRYLWPDYGDWWIWKYSIGKLI